MNRRPVARDQSTALPGFFAAGDVTDAPDRQIVIAAGVGAQAALSAYRYLMRMQSETSRGMAPGWVEAAMAGVPS